ncbi:hypothetical protein OY671_012275 [Metschnikowia pulcherrima]|nr:hypothetical protein OY671_012275 [Metschnikowia pulcherrima]
MAVCAEGQGAGRQLHESTSAYTKERKQFGQPIGRFQASQFRSADMMIEAAQVASMTSMGTLKLDLPAEQRKAAVSLAKAKGSKSSRFIGQNAVQTHGGIGITVESAAGHDFKRSTMSESQFGPADWHLERYEASTSPA